MDTDRPRLEQWWDDMKWIAQARATRANLLYDCENDRFGDRHRLQIVMRAVIDDWAALSEPAEPERKMQTCIASYCCVGQRVRAVSGPCSRVMHVVEFLKRHLTHRSTGRRPNAPVTADEVRDLDGLDLSGQLQGEMRNARGFAWVTLASCLEDIRTRQFPADEARNRLGLTHYDQDHHLIEVRYPASLSSILALHRPTFIEGCPSMIYRSFEGPEGWGAAVHLEDPASPTTGLPEAVHPSVTCVDGMVVYDLGRLTTPCPTPGWAEFEGCLPARVDDSSPDLVYRYVFGDS
jgi:hypothetical protein